MQYTHTFEIIYDGKTVEGKVGQREDGHSHYEISSPLPPILADTVHDLVKSLHKIPNTVTSIEIKVV